MHHILHINYSGGKMLRQTYQQSQQDDSHISEKSHDDIAHNLLERTGDTSRKDSSSLRNHFNPQTIIPNRETSASIDQRYFIEAENQRNVATGHDFQERIDFSLALPFLHHTFSNSPMFPMNSIAGSYFNNLAEDAGIRSYLGYSASPFSEYQNSGQYPPSRILQNQPIYHDNPFRYDSSSINPFSNNCISIYANGSEEIDEKTKHIKVSVKSLKKARKRKPKDRPKRPLSAYNIYFQEERQKILSKIPDTKVSNEYPEKKQRSRPKIPHGKIGFESLAKEIGQRWQRLDVEQVNHYKGLAVKEMIRYKETMRIFRGDKNEINSESSTPRDVLDSAKNHVDESLV